MTIEKNGITVPELLSKDFFKKSLENGLNISNVSIDKILFSMGSSGGDNYCSQIYRAVLTYTHDGCKESKDISLIVKYMPFEGESEVLKEMEVYEREVKMYFEVVPEMEKLLGNKVILAPKCLYAVAEPVQTMVFEDLSASGYILGDRIAGLDEEHTKILLAKMSQFHAASMVLAKKKPELAKMFNRSMAHSTSDSAAKDAIFLGNLQYLSELLNTWPNYETIANKLKNLIPKFYEKCLKTVERSNNCIAVINHGDLWVNNMMFKREKNVPKDVVLIDLQMSYYGSLGVDLNYFLNTSVPIGILKTKRYELLRFYYGNFKAALNGMNYSPIPSWDDVKNEIRATEFYGFLAFEAVLPLIALDRETSKDNSIEAFADKEKTQRNREVAFSSKRILETTKYALDRFDELGVLDL